MEFVLSLGGVVVAQFLCWDGTVAPAGIRLLTGFILFAFEFYDDPRGGIERLY